MNTADLTINTTEFLGPGLLRLQSVAIGMAVVGLAMAVIGWFVDPNPPTDQARVFHSYLYAYLFWAGVSAGSLVLLMIHHVVGGGWGYIIRRFLEAAASLMWLMLLLFVPIIIGLLYFGLYKWNLPGVMADPVMRHKEPYLNTTSFIGRTIFYFVSWGILAYVLKKWDDRQSGVSDIRIESALNHLSAVGLVFYALTGSFSSFDWVMSLTPKWDSTIFGLLFMVSQVLSAMALVLFLFGYLAGDKPLTQETPRGYFRDLGNLMLMLIMLWGYMSFSQYLLTFTANGAEEVTWYSQRAHGGWGLISLALIPIHFFLPFMVLLVGSNIKKNPRKLMWIAFYVILMRLMDLYWWVTPTFRPTVSLGIADVGTPLLIGGIWLWFWARAVKDRPLVPIHDPRIEGHILELTEHG